MTILNRSIDGGIDIVTHLSKEQLIGLENRTLDYVAERIAAKMYEELGSKIIAAVDVQALANAAVAQAIREGNIMNKVLPGPVTPAK